VAPLGTGGMEEVYRDLDLELHRDVALEVLPPRVEFDPASVERLQRETRAPPR